MIVDFLMFYGGCSEKYIIPSTSKINYRVVGFTCLALTNVLIHLTFRALAFSSSQRHSAACFFSWMRLIRSSERLGSPGLE